MFTLHCTLNPNQELVTSITIKFEGMLNCLHFKLVIENFNLVTGFDNIYISPTSRKYFSLTKTKNKNVNKWQMSSNDYKNTVKLNFSNHSQIDWIMVCLKSIIPFLLFIHCGYLGKVHWFRFILHQFSFFEFKNFRIK